MENIVPDFIVAGFAKCGSTSMCNALERHKEIIFSSIKEPNYYSTPLGFSNLTSWYNRLFERTEDYSLFGEGSVSYTNPNRIDFTVGRIAKASPECRLVFMVRNPFERLKSDWKMRLREGSVSESFEDSICSNATLLNHGLYWKAISKYLEYFSADKIIVVFLEDFKKDHNREMLRVYNHLRLTSNSSLSLPTLKSNQSENFRKDTKISSVIKKLPIENIKRLLPSEAVQFLKGKLTRTWDYEAECSSDTLKDVCEFYKDDIRHLMRFCDKPENFWGLDSLHNTTSK